MELTDRQYDCVVVGGGPAGCCTAALVAERGHSTLLVERDRMPRFHVGESLMPETFWSFERLGVLESMRTSPFVRKVGVQFVAPSGTESQPFFFAQHDPRECALTWHVERAAFDQLLFDNARSKGAECRDATKVIDIDLRPESPHRITLREANCGESTISARVVVDATGQQGLIANRLGLRRVNPDLKKAAIWGHFRGAQRTAPHGEEITLILHTAEKRGWFWYIPLSNDKVSIGLVADSEYLLKQNKAPGDVFDEHVRQCPALRERIAGAELLEKLQVVREFSYTTTRHAGPGWVLVGDAFGFIDPVYSTGVLLALRSGELAADAICDGLSRGDLSERQLGRWTDEFKVGIERFRALVSAFYCNEFSFARFMRQHPQYRGRLTDLLIGRAFEEEIAPLVTDLDAAVSMSRASLEM